MTEVRACKRGINRTTFPIFILEVLRFPFGENEALCFAVQYVNETAQGRTFWLQRYKIFPNNQYRKRKKLHASAKIPSKSP